VRRELFEPLPYLAPRQRLVFLFHLAQLFGDIGPLGLVERAIGVALCEQARCLGGFVANDGTRDEDDEERQEEESEGRRGNGEYAENVVV
jgi:hypothetical protein